MKAPRDEWHRLEAEILSTLKKAPVERADASPLHLGPVSVLHNWQNGQTEVISYRLYFKTLSEYLNWLLEMVPQKLPAIAEAIKDRVCVFVGKGELSFRVREALNCFLRESCCLSGPLWQRCTCCHVLSVCRCAASKGPATESGRAILMHQDINNGNLLASKVDEVQWIEDLVHWVPTCVNRSLV